MKPVTSTRMRKGELVRVYLALKERGYSLPFGDVRPAALYREDLLYAIEMAEAPSTVFGHSHVLVEKRESSLDWAISAPASDRPFLLMKWVYAFRWRELAALTTASDQFAALEACVRTEPLTHSDLACLEAAYPGVTQLERFWVDPDESEWEVEESDEEPAPLPREAGPITGVQPSLGRKITY